MSAASFRRFTGMGPLVIAIAVVASLVMILVLTRTWDPAGPAVSVEPTGSQVLDSAKKFAETGTAQFKKFWVRLTRGEFEDWAAGLRRDGSAYTAMYFPGECPGYREDILVKSGAPPLERFIVPEKGCLLLVRAPEWTRDPSGFEVWT